MELVIRAAFIYFFVLVVLRLAGKRQFSEMTTFDLILLLIISEAVSQGLYGSADYSLTASVLLVSTLVIVDIGLSHLKQRIPLFDDVVESKPTWLMKEGQLIERNLKVERIAEEDILTAARQNFGIDDMKDIKHAILERDGAISIIPAQGT